MVSVHLSTSSAHMLHNLCTYGFIINSTKQYTYKKINTILGAIIAPSCLLSSQSHMHLKWGPWAGKIALPKTSQLHTYNPAKFINNYGLNNIELFYLIIINIMSSYTPVHSGQNFAQNAKGPYHANKTVRDCPECKSKCRMQIAWNIQIQVS